MSSILQLQGYSCFSAASIQQGIELFQKVQPNIVLCDLLIPQGNGFMLLEFVQSFSPKTPVVLMSGDDIVYQKDNHLAAGFVAAFNKAQELDQLLDYLKIFLASNAT